MDARRLPVDAWLAAVLFALAVGYFLLSFNHTFELQDEGHYLNRSSLVARGLVPHRDFTTIYGPAAFVPVGLVLKVFGPEILPVRVLLVLVKAGAVVLTFLLARRGARRWLAFLAGVVAILCWGRPIWVFNTPYPSLYTVPLCLLSAHLAIGALGRESRRGLFLAGLVAGSTLLFKQSLGVFHVYGMGLALLAIGVLGETGGARTRAASGATLAAWSVAAAAPLVAVAGLLSPSDYAIHFLPLHLGMAALAAAGWAGGARLSLRALLARGPLPFAAGCAVLPAIAVLFYAVFGGLGPLLSDMFVLPRQLVNYRFPIVLPPAWLVAATLAAFGALGALLAGLARRSGAALGIAGVAAAAGLLAVLLRPATEIPWSLLWLSSLVLGHVQPGAIVAGTAALLAWGLLRGPERDRAVLRVGVPLFFCQAFLVFQMFPRAGVNAFLVQAAALPLLAVLLERVLDGAAPAAAPGARRRLAGCIVALPLVWVGAPALQNLPGQVTGVFQEVDLPGTRGIRLDPAWLEGRTGRFRELARYLLDREPTGAPLVLLADEQMTLFVTGRDSLFPEADTLLLIAGFNQLSRDGIRAIDQGALIDRLRARPETLVVDGGDRMAKRLRISLPELARFVDRNYVVERSFGTLRVLRSRRLRLPPPRASG